MMNKTTSFLFITIPLLFYINPGGVPIFSAYLLTILLFFLLIFAHIQRLPVGLKTPISIPILIPLLIIFSLPGTLFGETQSSSFQLARYLHLINFTLFYLLVRYFSHWWDLEKILYYLMLISLISPIVAIVQSISYNTLQTDAVIRFFRDNASLFYGANAAELFGNGYYSWLASTTFLKAPGVFTTPVENAFYSVFILCLSLAFYTSKVKSRYWSTKSLLLISALHIINIVLAATRSIWIAAIVALVVLLWKFLLRAWVRILGISILFVVVFFVFNLLVGEDSFWFFLSNTRSLSDPSTVGRLDTLRLGFELFLSHPWFGVGIGNADLLLEYNIHSMAITFLAELGILGVSYLFIFYSTLLISSFKLSRNQIPLNAALGMAFIAIVCAHFVNASLFANNFFHPKIAMPLWGLYAVVMTQLEITRAARSLRTVNTSRTQVIPI